VNNKAENTLEVKISETLNRTTVHTGNIENTYLSHLLTYIILSGEVSYIKSRKHL